MALSTMRSRADALPLTALRQAWEDAALSLPSPCGVTMDTIVLGGVLCRRVLVTAAIDDAICPMIYLPGGGYTAGSSRTHLGLVAAIARIYPGPVIVPDYRLAPEHPFPAAIDDVEEVIAALIQDDADYVLAGDSAGGGLAVATMLRQRDLRGKLPLAAWMLSPWTDLRLVAETLTSNAERDVGLSTRSLAASAEAYLAGQDPATVLASPVLAELSGLPFTLVQAGADELLLDDARHLAERMARAGVECQLSVYPAMWHVWHHYYAILQEARAAIEEGVAGVLRRVRDQPTRVTPLVSA